MNIERRIDESALDYHRRLVFGKLVDKTLSDLDYSELAELVYGQPYSSDVARRMLYGSRKTLEILDSEKLNHISDSDILSEIDAKTVELRKERKRFYDQRREYNKLIDDDGRFENLTEALVSAANALNDTIGNIYPSDSSDAPIVCGESEAVLVFSDWHYGMIVENAFNSFNKEVCKRRVAQVVDSAIKRIRTHKCSKLHIVVLGDLFHGAIHTSARVASEELVCDQIMQVSEILAQSVIELSKYVDETIVYMTYGNHGRVIPNKKDNIHRDNFERLIPWWLKQRISKYENITVADDNGLEFLFVNAAGHWICAAHGDLDKVRESPRLLTTLFFKQYGMDIEYILLGDKHHVESFGELGVVAEICGSLCGSDDYANDKRLFSTPTQLLLIVDPEVGVDAEYRIKCK